MIVYHGTTSQRANRICQQGFLPRKPSKRVWFATSKAYARGRARTQARRSKNRPVVLTCEIDLNDLRRRLGARRVFVRGNCIAISATVPVTALRTYPDRDFPTSPYELAGWVNRLLGLKHHRKVGQKHPGIVRLARWVANRLNSRPESGISQAELAQVARQWLPDFFAGIDIDPESLRIRHKAEPPELAVEVDVSEIDSREARALDLLEDESPRRRARGLGMMADIADPDLAEWCCMYLDDPAEEVLLAALRLLGRCEEADAGLIEPLTRSDSRNVRACAIAAMARHGGQDAPGWFERGLKDPEPCVRIETAGMLKNLDPAENKRIFRIALVDPNPQVVALAERLTAGKGFAKLSW